MREIISIRLACAGAQEQKGRKAGRKEARKKSHKKCIFHVCVERPLAEGRSTHVPHMYQVWLESSSRGIPTKLGTCVRLTDVIKRAKCPRYNFIGFGAARC